MARLDPHSYYDTDQPRTVHLDLDFTVDFARKRVASQVILHLAAPLSGPLDLDTKGLEIAAVRTDAGRPIPFELGAEEPILGRRLRLQLPAGTEHVAIACETGPDAIGLQWLEPAQTAGKRHPFMFTQFQPIHARSVLPVPGLADGARDVPRGGHDARGAGGGDVGGPAGEEGRGPGADSGAAYGGLPHAAGHSIVPDRAGGGRSRLARPEPALAGVGGAGDGGGGGVGVRRRRGDDHARPRGCSGRTSGTATTCWCCRRRSRTAGWRTRG